MSKLNISSPAHPTPLTNKKKKKKLILFRTPVPHLAENTTESDRLYVRVFDSNYGILG